MRCARAHHGRVELGEGLPTAPRSHSLNLVRYRCVSEKIIRTYKYTQKFNSPKFRTARSARAHSHLSNELLSGFGKKFVTEVALAPPPRCGQRQDHATQELIIFGNPVYESVRAIGRFSDGKIWFGKREIKVYESRLPDERSYSCCWGQLLRAALLSLSPSL